MRKLPVYLWECIVCKENFYSENEVVLHCNKLVMWVAGIPGKGCNLKSKIVKVKVSGWIELSEENLAILLSHNDPHMGILYALHMSYCDASNMTFEPEE